MTIERYRLQIELEADSAQDAAFKLLDIANDLQSGRASGKSVFASPSCSGVVTLHRPGAGLTNNEGSQ